MSTKAMYDIKETLCAELDQYAKKGNLSRTDLDTVHMITDTVKNICKITMLEEDGYSYGNGNWNAYGSYDNGMMDARSRRSGYYGGNTGRRSGMNYSNDANDTEYMENRLRREMY